MFCIRYSAGGGVSPHVSRLLAKMQHHFRPLSQIQVDTAVVQCTLMCFTFVDQFPKLSTQLTM